MMKNLYYSFLLSLLSLSACTSQTKSDYVIGNVSNGNFVLTKNIDKVQEHWKSVMKTQNNEQPIIDVKIISATNEENREVYFLVVGQNSKHTFKIATEVYSNGNQIYFKESLGAGTVTCSGCNYGCNPVKVGKDWFCDGGCGSNCTKTVTINTNQ